jgi:BirA family transcriptional regulator, biotin operon repressor / biotin---[acetyl-CoA-carboxylase] ligase
VVVDVAELQPGTRGPERLDEGALRAALLGPAGPLSRLEVLARTGSTSTDLVERLRADPEAWADGGLLVAEHQDAGRGRAGHTWQTPPGTALTFSLAVRPGVPERWWGWLPLLTGLAVARAVRSTSGVAAEVKWPNDVLVPGPAGGASIDGWGLHRKVAGILAEVAPTPDGRTVVLGIGINVAQEPDDLPVPSATSIRAAGGSVTRGDLLVAVVRSLRELLVTWRATDGDPVAAGLDRAVAELCRTLGTAVRAELPGGEELRGTAVRLAPDGGLVVRAADGAERTVLAGDVRHVRPAGELGSIQ